MPSIRNTIGLLEHLPTYLERSLSDPGMARTLVDGRLPQNFRFGIVVDTIPSLGAYVIQGSLVPRTVCVDLTSCCGILGARQFTAIPIGSSVFVYLHPQENWGIILGVIPHNTTRTVSPVSDWIRQACRAGYVEDPIYHWPTRQKDGGGVPNFSSGRPVDVLPGDWGYVTDMGLSVGLGRLMAWLRASDAAKIEIFRLDHLVRMMAYNLEIFTAGSEEQYVDDEGEFSIIRSVTPYQWEGTGITDPQNAAFRENVVERSEMGQNEARVEPQQAEQTGYFRYLNFQGYLGDLVREYVALPPNTDEVAYIGSEQTPSGLFERRVGLDGSYKVRSARSILFEKTLLIPIPVQRKRFEDPAGDSAENYQSAQRQWETNDPTVPRMDFDPITTSPILRAMLISEEQAFADQSYSVDVFRRHVRDWRVSTDEEEAQRWGLDPAKPTSIPPLEYPLPPYKDVAIDHRTTARFYRSRSRFGLTADGGFIVEDGYGGQLLMTGGNLYLTVPGDIVLRPGRSVIHMAPGDIILRAGGDVDVSSSRGSVRVKAETDLKMLAGNRTAGTIVVENRHGDVVVKTSDAHKVYAGELFTLAKKTITLDVREKGTIVFNTGTLFTRIHEQAIDEYVARTSEDTIVNRWKGTEIYLGADTVNINGSLKLFNVGSRLHVNGEIVGEVLISHDRVYAMDGPKNETGTAYLLSKRSNKAAEYSDEIQRIREIRRDGIDRGRAYEQINTNAADGPGNPDGISRIGFSFRSSSELGLGDDYVIHEAPWQKRYRSGSVTTCWSETSVDRPGSKVETMPYPGFECWTGRVLRTVTSKFFNVADDKIEVVTDSMGNQAAVVGTGVPQKEYLTSV